MTIVTDYQNEKIFLTMPVYNEEMVIEDVIRKNFAYISKFKNGKLLVTEDGSTDETKKILKRLQKEFGFILVSSPKRKGAARGQKDALKECLLAGADIVLFTDSDNQHDPKDFDLQLTALKNSDMAVGRKINRKDPLLRRWGSKVWNLYIRLYFGTKLHDVNCGFRAIRRSVLERHLAKNETFDECVLSELSIRSSCAGDRVVEVPVAHFWREDKPKAWNPKKIPKIAWQLFLKSHLLRKELKLNNN